MLKSRNWGRERALATIFFARTMRDIWRCAIRCRTVLRAAGVLAFVFTSACGNDATAAFDRPKLPRFESFKSDKINMREGPSRKHRVKWVYHHKGLPVEVLTEYDVWRRVRDYTGEIGWVHVAILSRDRTAVISGKDLTPVRRRADSASAVIGRAQPGAIGHIESCDPFACELNFGKVEGWVDRTRLWGVYADEHF
jgi:SH3-like domain-containing protein